MKRRMEVTPILEAIVVGLAGALCFKVVHLPLQWMLGPLTAVTTWRFSTSRSLEWPSKYKSSAMVVFGYMLGASFTRETVIQIKDQLLYMLFSTLLLLLFSLLIGGWIARKAKTGMINGLLGSVPGGLSQILMVVDEIEQVDTTIVTFMQTIRVISVVFLVPFLIIHGLGGNGGNIPSSTTGVPASHWYSYALFAIVAVLGAYIGKWLRLPASSLTGPLLATAIFTGSGVAAPHLPIILKDVAQISLGIHLGMQIKPQLLKGIQTLVVYTIASCFLLVLFSLLIAYGLTLWTHIDLHTAFLSTAPGGIAEMGITATTVNADLSMVTGYQLFRIFFMMFIVVPALQWWIKKSGKNEMHIEKKIKEEG